jgi:hypothetical protein
LFPLISRQANICITLLFKSIVSTKLAIIKKITPKNNALYFPTSERGAAELAFGALIRMKWEIVGAIRSIVISVLIL